MDSKTNKKSCILLVVIIIFVVLLTLTLGLVFGLKKKNNK